MLCKNTHQSGESLVTLTKPAASKQPTLVDVSTKPFMILQPNYGAHKQNDLAVFTVRVKSVLKFDAVIYPKERDRVLFMKQYLVDYATATWCRYCLRHQEGDHTRAAMKDILDCQVALIKHHTNAAFHQLNSAMQGPDRLFHHMAPTLSLPVRKLTSLITISACVSGLDSIWRYSLPYAKTMITSPVTLV